MSQPKREPALCDTWSDIELPNGYRVDLDGLSDGERQAAVAAIEELVRPLRKSGDPENDPRTDSKKRELDS